MQLQPSLPSPELTEEPARPDAPPILEGVHPGTRPLVEPGEPLPPDVPFVMPQTPSGTAGDIGTVPVVTMPRAQPEEPPPPFAVSAGGGFTVQLIDPQQVYYARLDQRFDVRIPELDLVRVGFGVAEMISDLRYFVEVGPTIGMGAYFCEDRVVRCEGIIVIQPGLAAGDFLGAQFLFRGALDVRFLFERIVSVAASVAFSRIGEGNFLHFGGLAGIHFG